MRALKENHVLLLAILEPAGAGGIGTDDFIARIAEISDITRDALRRNLDETLEFGFAEITAESPSRLFITTAGKAALRNWRAKH